MSRRKLEAAVNTSAKNRATTCFPEGTRTTQQCAELWRGWLRDVELTVAHRITYESNPKQVYCPLFDEGTKKPVKKWHLICTHKYTHTQSRKGRPSLCFSPFAYFPISHNTNQTAKLTRPPNKSAILWVYRRAPWQHQPNKAFGTPAPLPYADPWTAVPPLSEAAPALTARFL